jgi:hypothetical protein
MQEAIPNIPIDQTAQPAAMPYAENTEAPTVFSLKPKKKINLKLILGCFLFLFLLVGGASAYWLSQQNQDVRQRASGETYGGKSCGTAGSTQCDATGQLYVCQNYVWVTSTKFSSYDVCKASGNNNTDKNSCTYGGKTYMDGQCINEGARCANGQQAKVLDGSCGGGEVGKSCTSGGKIYSDGDCIRPNIRCVDGQESVVNDDSCGKDRSNVR